MHRKQKTPPKRGSKLSAREDSNLRPTGPKPVALPSALLAEILLFEFLVQFFKVVGEGGDLNPHVRKDTNT